LTSARALFDEISRLISENTYNWILKFHPKMDTYWVNQYKSMASENCKFIEDSNINQVLQSADVMISDTSSVIGEFSLLHKPVITLNNSNPGDYLINISTSEQLSEAIKQAFNPSDTLASSIKNYAQSLHPYNDGQSSARILNVVENILVNGKKSTKPLPLNLFRTLKLRKALNYWKL